MTSNGNHTLENWLTEDEAAERLGMSARTLRRKTAAGEGPEKRERQRPGLRPEPVYNPEDVARLSATPPAVFAPSSPLAPRPAPPQPAPNLGAFEQLAALLHGRLQAQPRPPARFVTVKQASALTGLSQTRIRGLIASGRLRALRDGGFKILEADLANLDTLTELATLTVSRAMSRGAQ